MLSIADSAITNDDRDSTIVLGIYRVLLGVTRDGSTLHALSQSSQAYVIDIITVIFVL